MKKFFAIVTILFAFFAKFSFAQQIIRVPQEKMTEDDFQIHSRIFLDNFIYDEYQSTDRQNEFKNNGLMFDLVTQAFYKNWFGYFNYRIQENPTQSSEEQRRQFLATGGGDKSYENHFGLMREFYLGYENEDFRVYGGKFRPTFGKAWLLGRGIWTQELSVNYMQLERLGLGGALKFGDKKKNDAYELAFAAYNKDVNVFDNTQLTVRDPSDKIQGNSGENRGLTSYTLNLDMNFDFGNKEKLFYRFALTNLSVNERQAINRLAANKIEDEKGFSATMIYEKSFNDDIYLNYLAEYADIKNINGDGDVSDRYFNTSLITNLYDNWNITLGYANRRNLNIGQNGFDQRFSEISAGYSFDKTILFDQLTLQIGHKNLRTNFKNEVDKRNILGFMIRYQKWI